MGKVRRRSQSTQTRSLLLVALGAAAGLAIGLVLSERRAAARRGRSPRPLEEFDPYQAHDDAFVADLEDGGDDIYEDDYDDDDDFEEGEVELAGEAMSHLHLEPDSDLRPEPVTLAPAAEALEARVLEVFRNDPILAQRTIDIGALASGVIELTGWVERPSEIAHALTLARGVPDVHEVVHSLALRPRAAS